MEQNKEQTVYVVDEALEKEAAELEEELDILEKTLKERNERLLPKGLKAGFCKCCGEFLEVGLEASEFVCDDCEESQ